MFLSIAFLLWPASAAAEELGFAPVFPPGFRDVVVPGDWVEPVLLTFDPLGRLYVLERRGVVWRVENDHKLPTPFLDLSCEVDSGFGKGMKGFVLDPGFARNGHVYGFYDVDRHHLLYHGTPRYDRDANDYTNPTIARITRFTASARDGMCTADPATRKVLVGESAQTGFPIIDYDHGSGTVVFGLDGSLLAGCGDSAQAVRDNGGTPPSAAALKEGILRPADDVGAFRSQVLQCLDGKIIRIDPETGDGLPSNPFFDPEKPRSSASRVWSIGLRNPFRFAPMPGTRPTAAAASPAASYDHPGVLLIGDLGLSSFEEINLCTHGGQNFGWPLFEGMSPAPGYDLLLTNHLDALNPVHAEDGAIELTCGRRHFRFQDLLCDDCLHPGPHQNPCDPTLPISSDLHPCVHSRPSIAWGRSGPALTKSYDSSGQPVVFLLTDPKSPIRGPCFGGTGSIAGTWYDHAQFPESLRGGFFFADYTGGWIKQLRFDGQGNILAVHDFGGINVGALSLAVDPLRGDLYYSLIGTNGPGEIHRISYSPDNKPPVAAATAIPDSGASPLIVRLDASGSQDPEGGPLRCRWDFGDGTPAATGSTVVHVFPSEDITSQGIPDSLPLHLAPRQDADEYHLATINDGICPEFPTTVDQYFTYYSDLSLKGGGDWLGYVFPRVHRFHGLCFQEGTHVETGGGWFEQIRVEVRSDGEWHRVEDAVFDPPYAGFTGRLSQKYRISLPPIEGDGIRLSGRPGGPYQFLSVCELRVLACPQSEPGPGHFTVTLTVTDDANVSATIALPIHVDDR